MKGTNAEARALNGFLDAIKNKVYASEKELAQDGKVITYQSFKEKWFGVDVKQYLILEVFQQHNEQVSPLIGKDFSATTLNVIKLHLNTPTTIYSGSINYRI